MRIVRLKLNSEELMLPTSMVYVSSAGNKTHIGLPRIVSQYKGSSGYQTENAFVRVHAPAEAIMALLYKENAADFVDGAGNAMPDNIEIDLRPWCGSSPDAWTPKSAERAMKRPPTPKSFT